MEHQQPDDEQIARREVVLRLHPNELVPEDAQIDAWRHRIAEYSHDDHAHYCLGVLMASVEDAAKAIDRGDQRSLTSTIRLGLAATAAYEQLTTEQRGTATE
jgi:hypothetical protein